MRPAALRAVSISWSVTTLVSRRECCRAARTMSAPRATASCQTLRSRTLPAMAEDGNELAAVRHQSIAYSLKKERLAGSRVLVIFFTSADAPRSRPFRLPRMATDTTLRPAEIKDILLREIEAADLHELNVEEVGTVLEVKDGIARIYGLGKAMAGEMLEVTSSETGNKVTALALNLEEDNIGSVILGDYLQLKEGDEVRRTGRVLEVPVGPALVGRVVDALGRPIDGLGDVVTTHSRKAEAGPPGIIVRQPVKEPLQTGIKAIDSMIPIGRGQRELIIGDRGTGKTALAVDTIINQKGQGVVCVYVAIGQKRSTVATVVERLKEHDAME